MIVLCPTCWMIHKGETWASFNNHKEWTDLWNWLLTNIKDTEMKAQIIEAQMFMKTIKVMFACRLGETLLWETDSLS